MIRMNEILFSYLQKNCPDCGSKLREYRRDKKLVRKLSGEFTAVHKIMICSREKKEYRSERLFEIVPKRCRYSNDRECYCFKSIATLFCHDGKPRIQAI